MNSTVKKTLKDISASVTAVVGSSPQISRIAPCGRLTGKKLKVVGETNGIYFIPFSEGETAKTDEERWMKTPDSFVTRTRRQR